MHACINAAPFNVLNKAVCSCSPCTPSTSRMQGLVPQAPCRWNQYQRRSHATAAQNAVAQGHLQRSQLQYEVRLATTPAELRAAAYLRAYSFYTYPADRSEMAARAHRRMKADAEWDALSAKVAGTDVLYKHMKVFCLIATIQDDSNNAVAQQVLQDMDLSTKLPAAGQGVAPELVIGTLDINQGAVLPAEELIGELPSEGAATGRGYLSNVCVAPAARQQGVAQRLIRQAEGTAAELGVQHLYVHVVHSNTPAVQLYTQALGFRTEVVETVGFARALQRPRRLLLVKSISGA